MKKWHRANRLAPVTRKPRSRELNPVFVTYEDYFTGQRRCDSLAVYDERINAWRWYEEGRELNDMEIARVPIVAWMLLPEPFEE